MRFAEGERLQALLCVQPTYSGDGASTEISVLLGQVQVKTSLLTLLLVMLDYSNIAYTPHL